MLENFIIKIFITFLLNTEKHFINKTLVQQLELDGKKNYSHQTIQ